MTEVRARSRAHKPSRGLCKPEGRAQVSHGELHSCAFNPTRQLPLRFILATARLSELYQGSGRQRRDPLQGLQLSLNGRCFRPRHGQAERANVSNCCLSRSTSALDIEERLGVCGFGVTVRSC
jgi:hypothetical protein